MNTAATAAGITFAVAEVRPASEPLREIPCRQAAAEFLDSPIEACSRHHGTLVANIRAHPLIAALHAGFNDHRPVVLSPDIIWLTLCQGFAHHVNIHAKTLRSRLVKHSGKPKLTVRRNDFVKGSPENDWPGVFAEFSAAIRKHVGKTQSLMVSDFSTTGPVERVASEVVLLDTLQEYFEYEVQSSCGIPSITLEGTPADWRRIAKRMQEFRRFDLDWWVKRLKPVLGQFVAASQGDVDRPFWDSIYKWHGARGSGSPFVTGWILNLFPYLDNWVMKLARRRGWAARVPSLERNNWLSEPSANCGPSTVDFPGMPAKAPFLWKCSGTDHKMEFIGGLIGVAQHPTTLALRPEIGWAIREA
jgi:hypothetical protein